MYQTQDSILDVHGYLEGEAQKQLLELVVKCTPHSSEVVTSRLPSREYAFKVYLKYSESISRPSGRAFLYVMLYTPFGDYYLYARILQSILPPKYTPFSPPLPPTHTHTHIPPRSRCFLARYVCDV